MGWNTEQAMVLRNLYERLDDELTTEERVALGAGMLILAARDANEAEDMLKDATSGARI